MDGQAKIRPRCVRCNDTNVSAATADTIVQLPAAKSVRTMCGMTTCLVNHLRIPGGIPREEGLKYLEQVEETVRPFGGKWLAQGDVEVVEGAWPGYGFSVADLARKIRAATMEQRPA